MFSIWIILWWKHCFNYGCKLTYKIGKSPKKAAACVQSTHPTQRWTGAVRANVSYCENLVVFSLSHRWPAEVCLKVITMTSIQKIYITDKPPIIISEEQFLIKHRLVPCNVNWMQCKGINKYIRLTWGGRKQTASNLLWDKRGTEVHVDDHNDKHCCKRRWVGQAFRAVAMATWFDHVKKRGKCPLEVFRIDQI